MCGVAAWLGEASDAALGCVGGMSDMRLVGRRTWQVPSNWKVVCDNYLVRWRLLGDALSQTMCCSSAECMKQCWIVLQHP